MADNDRIFISYAKEDSEIAVKVADRLEDKGYKTWYYSRDSLEYPNMDWMALIAKAVIESSAFILFISNNSIDSVMVDKEVNFAIEENKDIFPLFYNITSVANVFL